MKQQRIARERIFGPTPEVVTRRLTYALNHLEEEPPMKKRSVPILVFILLLILAGVAYAALTGGLEWYYETYFNYGGGLPQDIAQRIQNDVPQTGEENPLVNVIVAGATWLGKGLGPNLPDSEMLNIMIRASAKDTDTYEMVPSQSIDADGARGDEERRQHPEYGNRADEPWLWAYDTYGPLDRVMKEPKKQLLIFGRSQDGDFRIKGVPEAPLSVAFYDMQADSDTGEVVILYGFELNDQELKALRAYADADGYVELSYTSWAVPFTGEAQDAKGETGVTTFRIELP
jgi:hypothetical protein